MGAVQSDARRSRPRGAFAGGAALPEAAAMRCRAEAVEKSCGDHSPHAEPAARIPSGVRIMRTASAIQTGFVLRQPLADSAVLPEARSIGPAPGAVASNKEGSARCK